MSESDDHVSDVQQNAWRVRDVINERLQDLGWQQQDLVRASGRLRDDNQVAPKR